MSAPAQEDRQPEKQASDDSGHSSFNVERLTPTELSEVSRYFDVDRAETSFDDWLLQNPDETQYDQRTQMDHWMRDGIADTATTQLFLESVVASETPLRQKHLDRLYASVRQNENPRLSLSAVGAFAAHIERQATRLGIIKGDEDSRNITWQKLSQVPEGMDLAVPIAKVGEAGIMRERAFLSPAITAPFFDIASEIILSNTSEFPCTAYLKALMLLSDGSHTTDKTDISWQKVYDTVHNILAKDYSPYEGQVTYRELATRVLFKVVYHDSVCIPTAFKNAVIELLGANAKADESGKFQSIVGERVKHGLANLLAESTPYEIPRTTLGLPVYSFCYGQSDTHASKRKQSIFNHLAPYYTPTESDVREASVNAAKTEDSFKAAQSVAALVALYLYADSNGAQLHAVKSSALEALSSIATTSHDVNFRALAKVYLFNLHEKDGPNAEVTRVVFESFNLAMERFSETAAKSSILAVRHLCLEHDAPQLLAEVEGLARGGPSTEIRREATATLCAIYRNTGDLRIAADLQRLTVDEQLANDREAIRQTLRAPAIEDILESFATDVLKPFGAALQKADSQAAVYFSIEPVENEKDAAHESAILNPSNLSVGSHLKGMVRIQVHRLDAPAFLAAWQVFQERMRAFEEASSLQVYFLNDPKRKQADADLFSVLNRLPIELEMGPSLDEVVNWKSNLPTKCYGNAKRIVEPRPPHHVNFPWNDLYSCLTTRPGLERQIYFYQGLGILLLEGDRTNEFLIEEIQSHNKECEEYHSRGDGSTITLSHAHFLESLDKITRRKLFYALQGESFRRGTTDLYDEKRDSQAYVQEIDKILRNLFRNLDSIYRALNRFESYEVVQAELKRSVELLLAYRQAGNQEDFFLTKEFIEKPYDTLLCSLPRNEPLFTLVNEVISLSLFHEHVVVRVPDCFKRDNVLRDIATALGISDFLTEGNKTTEPICEHVHFCFERKGDEDALLEGHRIDTIVYAGTRRAANEVLKGFVKGDEEANILLVGAGSGNNPLVITKSAYLPLAVSDALDAVVRNCGQDCTSPCSILIEGGPEREEEFVQLLTQRLKSVPIGPYARWTTERNRIGPLNSADDETWRQIRNFVQTQRRYLHQGPGHKREIINELDRIVYPSIFRIPLSEGPSFEKKYAPFFVVQRYDDSRQLLEKFFGNEKYIENAMYVAIHHDDNNEFQALRAALVALRVKEQPKKRKDQKSVSTDSTQEKEAQEPEMEYVYTKDGDGQELHLANSIFGNCTLNTPGIDLGDVEFGGNGPGSTYFTDGKSWIARPYFVLNVARFGYGELSNLKTEVIPTESPAVETLR